MKVHDFFQCKEIPTLDSALVAINEYPDLPNFLHTLLLRILYASSFTYEKRDRKNMLIDREDICHWRCSYFRKIKEYCYANKKVYNLPKLGGQPGI